MPAISSLIFTSSPVGQYAWMGNANSQLNTLFGYNLVAMPPTGENYMLVAVISCVLTAFALCAFGIALLPRSRN